MSGSGSQNQEKTNPPQRFVVIGSTGSGKTTLATKLATLIDGTLLELDELAWQPGWKKLLRPQVREKVVGVVATSERWASAGNYNHLQDVLWARADVIVWIDFSFPRTFWQLTKRTADRVWNRRVCCNGNFETWKTTFCSRESIFLWLFSSYWRNRRTFESMFPKTTNSDKQNGNDYDSVTTTCGPWKGKQFVRLQSPSQVQNWFLKMRKMFEKTN